MSKLTDEIMGKLSAKKGSSEPADTGDEEPDMADSGEGDETYAGDEDKAVADMMDAVDSGDKEGFKAGLKAFLEVCVPKIVNGE